MANRKRSIAEVVLTAVATVLFAAIGAPAMAHTALVASTPSADQVVTDLTFVELQFSDEVLAVGSFLTLVHESGARTELDVEQPSATVVAAQVPDVAGGAYIIEWRVVAGDGHPIEGTIAFAYDPPQQPEPSPSEPPIIEPSPSPAPEPSAPPASP